MERVINPEVGNGKSAPGGRIFDANPSLAEKAKMGIGGYFDRVGADISKDMAKVGQFAMNRVKGARQGAIDGIDAARKTFPTAVPFAKPLEPNASMAMAGARNSAKALRFLGVADELGRVYDAYQDPNTHGFETAKNVGVEGTRALINTAGTALGGAAGSAIGAGLGGLLGMGVASAPMALAGGVSGGLAGGAVGNDLANDLGNFILGPSKYKTTSDIWSSAKPVQK